jgi:hypothetical protein
MLVIYVAIECSCVCACLIFEVLNDKYGRDYILISLCNADSWLVVLVLTCFVLAAWWRCKCNRSYWPDGLALECGTRCYTGCRAFTTRGCSSEFCWHEWVSGEIDVILLIFFPLYIREINGVNYVRHSMFGYLCSILVLGTVWPNFF